MRSTAARWAAASSTHPKKARRTWLCGHHPKRVSALGRRVIVRAGRMSRGSPDRDDVSRLLVRFDGYGRLDESPDLRSVAILRQIMYEHCGCAIHDADGRVAARAYTSRQCVTLLLTEAGAGRAPLAFWRRPAVGEPLVMSLVDGRADLRSESARALVRRLRMGAAGRMRLSVPDEGVECVFPGRDAPSEDRVGLGRRGPAARRRAAEPS
jgi:hypothetical protein